MSLITKITLLLISLYFILFGCMEKVKDKPSLLVGKIIPVTSGICIFFLYYFLYYLWRLNNGRT